MLGKGHIQTLESELSLSFAFFYLEKYDLAWEQAQTVLPKIAVLPSKERDSIETNAKLILVECLFEIGHDKEAEKVCHDLIQEGGIKDEPGSEELVKLYLAVLSTGNHSSNLSPPAIDEALTQIVRYPRGKRFLETIDLLKVSGESSNHPEFGAISSQGLSSSATYQESIFLQDLVNRAEPSITSIETEITPIQNVSMSLKTITFVLKTEQYLFRMTSFPLLLS